jgi:hypothetical protein
VANAGVVVPGDVIAIKYPPGSNTTGHVMMVQSLTAFRPRSYSTQDFLANGAYPQIPGFYDETVIDSSATCHGKTGTRSTKPGGIGRDATADRVGLGRLKP